MMKFIAILLLLLGVAVGILYSGIYNVAASRPHSRTTAALLDTVMARSVRRHAAGIEVPALSDETRVRAGRGSYGIYCVTCHGAPGVEPTAIGKGLSPEPPDLATAAGFWSDAELFWIAAHGVKMTGMPGFGPELDDEKLWSIVAFVRRMPEMTPEDYENLGRLR